MRILLAEDEQELSRALTAILKHSHYEVDAVYDGEDALAYGLAENYDGIILDIMMPKRDGLEVLKELRGQGVTTPVLFLTAKSEIADRIQGLDIGADDYLTKPFAMGELLARVRAMTRRRDAFQQAASFPLSSSSSASGATMLRPKLMWSGSIFPTCAKNSRRSQPMWRSKPPEAWAIHWR